MHPSQVLFQGTFRPVGIPSCDHYAGSEKLMRKSLALQQELGPVFDITFDCEDGAAAGDELTHAHLVGTLIASGDNRFGRVGVRVHDINSLFFRQDVDIVCRHAAQRLAYLVLPKVESAAEVERAIAIVNQYAAAAGRADLPIHVLIETHGALRDVHAIAALPQVECLSFGIMDFVSSHYGAIPDAAMRSPNQFSHPLVMRAKLEIAAAAHAFGKVASHNVTTEIRDLSVVADDARRALFECGYTRMWSIHPSQIKAILQAFTPNADEVSKAADILNKAQAANWGPIQQHGELHDRASYRYYWATLQRAKSSGMMLDAATAELLD
jgi:citrate lyase subunit beta / citryl-CoA lyase